MNKVSLAILISLSALTGAAYAQTDSGIIMSTDPQKAAEFEQHAQEAQAAQQQQMEQSAQSARPRMMKHPVHGHPAKKPAD